MSIRDVSNPPDDQVPEWVRRSRERQRELVKREVARSQYSCVSSGMYDSEYKCNSCNKHFMVQADNSSIDTPEKAAPCECLKDGIPIGSKVAVVVNSKSLGATAAAMVLHGSGLLRRVED